jgi:hypothetical protein
MRPKILLPDAVVDRAAERIRNREGITIVAASCGVAHGTLRQNFARFEQHKDLALRPSRKRKVVVEEQEAGWSEKRANEFLRMPLRPSP